ncbi:Mov34/MPN/PAD-1 family protein [Candidatus Bathyarchaeota archaeon]|nr:Mov34/MPN/PAD-1 family protein [Candidatus Bathyarchaeota archaeon]
MRVQIRRDVLRSILAWAGERHPNEIVLLLRGQVDKEVARVDEFLFPPHASGGRSFAQFPAHMLPIDFSVIGTIHSHPAGSPMPSPTDLNKFYGKVMMILAYPYREDCVRAYDRQGEPLKIDLIA